MTINRTIRLARRPVGVPDATVWRFGEEPVPDLQDGMVLVEAQYLSVDPAMRGWMADRPSYIAPVELGAVMRAGVAGIVVDSRSESLPTGSFVRGMLGTQLYATAAPADLTRLDDATLETLPVYLGALGVTGITAYFGLIEVGKAKKGDTVVVSGAAGGVGSIVGQIAKNLGCRVVGVAGGPAKCAHVVETLGFDAAVDYKAGRLKEDLAAACPRAIDVYFDNVGGDVLDEALTLLALHARIVICGAISQYNSQSRSVGPSNYMALLVKRATMTGMVVSDYFHRSADALAQISAWIDDGRLNAHLHVVQGLDSFPRAFAGLFSGDNIGKTVVDVRAG